MERANNDIRRAARAAAVPLWAVADRLEMSEAGMTRLLRRELPDKERQKIMDLITEIQAEAAADE